MRRLVRMSAWLVVLQLGQASIAWACECPPPTPEGAVSSGDAIVVATIDGVGGSGLGCGGLGLRNVRIEITEVVAGPAELGEMQIETPYGGSCEFEIAKDETWVLQIYESDGSPLASPCSVSQRIESDDDPWLVALRDAASAR